MDNNSGNNLLSSLSRGLNLSLFPGHRVPRVNGWEGVEKFHMPLDCEAVILDKDPNSNHIYMKYVDQNGDEVAERYRIEPDPVPKFEPDKYVSTNDFNSFVSEDRKFKEDVLNAINSLKQSVTANSVNAERSGRSGGNGKQSGRSDNGFRGSESDIQSDGK